MSEPVDQATEQYAEHRELLFSIAYNILGTVADTEDVLQEVWLAWAAADRDNVLNVRAYLVRITVNESLNRLRKVKRARETYVGPWLPEPIVGDAASEHVVQAESVSLAMLVVLETLTPLERAVFVLREVFGYPHAEIATMLGRTSAAVRQLASRARDHVDARHPREIVDDSLRRSATERFLAAAVGGDVTELLEVLAPDVTLWTDAGGKAPAARKVISGRDKIVKFVASPSARRGFAERTVRMETVNGQPDALVFFAGERLDAVGVLDVGADGLVHGIYFVVNPDKLKHVAQSIT